METTDLLQHLAADIDTVADVVRTGDPAAPIAGCPDWTLVDVVHHLGGVHRWARHAVLHAAPPAATDMAADPPPAGSDELADWLRAGGERLIVALLGVAPDAPTWHPFPVPLVASVWPRRQTQETSVHRWDAEHAVGRPATLAADLASDGIDEYLTVMVRRLVTREHLAVPTSVLGIRCTDTGAEWVVAGIDGDVVLVDSEPQARLQGHAESVLLRLWRRPVAEEAVRVDGDAVVAAAWLALGGA